MRASGTFTVAEFTPAPVPSPPIETAVSVGVSTMEKKYEGEVAGTGGMKVDTDGTHRIWFNYELAQ
ncbi:DUF3224 domain-containing protein [Streptomyces sp. NPDC051561]|uniref:DUF3224 domain-containing protein n=1 Tax=Streptomyces sp. NPDC051561 TaxID=3365658 RepID=UPI00379385AD